MIAALWNDFCNWRARRNRAKAAYWYLAGDGRKQAIYEANSSEWLERKIG